MKNTEGVPYGRGLEAPESSVLSVVLILLAIANIVTKKESTSAVKLKYKSAPKYMVSFGSTLCLPFLLSELFCLDGDGAVVQSWRSGA